MQWAVVTIFWHSQRVKKIKATLRWGKAILEKDGWLLGDSVLTLWVRIWAEFTFSTLKWLWKWSLIADMFGGVTQSSNIRMISCQLFNYRVVFSVFWGVFDSFLTVTWICLRMWTVQNILRRHLCSLFSQMYLLNQGNNQRMNWKINQSVVALLSDDVGAALINRLVVVIWVFRERNVNTLIRASELSTVSVLLCESKLNIFGLWTKRDIWGLHLWLLETLVDIFHLFPTRN